ncbi:MAG: hypothetical protein ACYC35_13915 [Pirellulales bacterium]
MNPIRVRKRIDSDTLQLPELKDLIGKTVEITVVEEASPANEGRYDAFFALAGEAVVDPEAYRALRAASMI